MWHNYPRVYLCHNKSVSKLCRAMWCSCKQMRQPIQFYDRFIHHLWIIIHLLYIGSEGKRKDTPSKCKRMAQPCALSVFLNLLLLITSFIGSNKSILNDVLSSIKDSPSWDRQNYCFGGFKTPRITEETRDTYSFQVSGSNYDTITDETRDSHDTFDTKFWDSFDVMLSCVFCWSQYLRVLILSCLSCSMVVIMIVTSMQTDRHQSKVSVNRRPPHPLVSAPHWIWTVAIRDPKGANGLKASTHKATQKFHAIWCL